MSKKKTLALASILFFCAVFVPVGLVEMSISATMQEEDAEFKRKRHEREGRKVPHPEIPLYTVDQAKASFPLFSPIRYEEPVRIEDGIEATFHDAGHIVTKNIEKCS